MLGYEGMDYWRARTSVCVCVCVNSVSTVCQQCFSSVLKSTGPENNQLCKQLFLMMRHRLPHQRNLTSVLVWVLGDLFEGQKPQI